MSKEQFETIIGVFERDLIKGCYFFDKLTKQSWMLVNSPNPTIYWENDGNGYYTLDYNDRKDDFKAIDLTN